MTFAEFIDTYQKKQVIEVTNQVLERPLVSVCIQTYQHENFIIKCLDSVLSQKTSFPFEILIGEDNSDDGTRQICMKYAKLYPERIRLFLHHRENQIKIGGEPSANFNAFYNFYSSRGSYIAFCEGDDFWNDSLKLQKQVDFLKNNPDYVLTYHSYDTIDRYGNPIISLKKIIQPQVDISSQDLLKGKYHPLLVSICFRNVLKEVPREITEVINVDTFLLSLLGNYGAAKFLPEIHPAKYRKHDGGIWSKRIKSKKFLSKIRTYNKLSLFYLKQNHKVLYELYKTKKLNTYKMLIVQQVRNRQIYKGLKFYFEYLKNR